MAELGDGKPPAGTSEPAKKPIIKQFIQSPNFSSRNGERIRRIILHYTTGSKVEGTIAHFQNPQSQVSAHYVIARNGDIYQMVRDADKAWHARGANADSIGIEHSAAVGEQLTAPQGAASVSLLRWLLGEYKLTKAAITGHRFTLENAGHTDCPGNLFGAARTRQSTRKATLTAYAARERHCGFEVREGQVLRQQGCNRPEASPHNLVSRAKVGVTTVSFGRQPARDR